MKYNDTLPYRVHAPIQDVIVFQSKDDEELLAFLGTDKMWHMPTPDPDVEGPLVYRTIRGPRPIEPGDYLVRDELGNLESYKPEFFHQRFKPSF